MKSDTANAYLLKAIRAFQRKLIVISPDFKVLAVHDPDSEMFKEGTTGNRCYGMLHERTEPCENCAVTEAMRIGGPALRPKPDDTVDLSRMPCYYAYPIVGENGEIESYVSMDFDLPTTGGLEAKIQQSYALLRNLVQSAVDGVIAADMKGNILFFNEMASEVFGYTEEQAVHGMNIGDIYPDSLEYEVMKKLRCDEFGGKGKLRAFQVDVVDKDGQRIPISLNASIVYEKGKEVASIGFFHDLREELHMKEKLKRVQLQLMQAEKMGSLGQLAAGVAHQLNNPLGGITLFTKLVLEEYDLTDGAREDLDRILKDAERCRDIVKELLEFTGQTRHLMQLQDINQAITRTLFLLQNQTLFQNIAVEKDLLASPPPVLADIQQLNHMFMNIILNAAQAMKGEGTLTVGTRRDPTGDKMRVRISDSGPGIPEDVVPHIFEPFYTTKEQGKGTGLGLSMVYTIVENHGGKIEARSAPGEGATFMIEFPIAKKKETEANECGD